MDREWGGQEKLREDGVFKSWLLLYGSLAGASSKTSFTKCCEFYNCCQFTIENAKSSTGCTEKNMPIHLLALSLYLVCDNMWFRKLNLKGYQALI